jgi:hypothetical protein
MLKPEQIFIGGASSEPTTVCLKGQSFEYQFLPGIAEAAPPGQDFDVLSRTAETTLVYSDSRHFAAAAIQHAEFLIPTVQSLLHNHRGNPVIQKTEGVQFHAGVKALIPAFRVQTNKGLVYFVAYVSRGDINTSLAEDCTQDCHDLTELAQRAKKRLTYSAANKYRVIRPITAGQCEVNGRLYPWFTMPFIQNMGQLGTAQQVLSRQIEGGRTLTVPFFRLTMTTDRGTQSFNQEMVATALATTKAIEAEEFSDIEEVKNTLEILMMPYIKHDYAAQLMSQRGHLMGRIGDKVGDVYKKWTRQFRDLLVGNALLFYLSDGCFPKNLQINAGDWMVKPISSGGFNMTLTSVRGGWQNLGSEDAWIDRMKAHREVYQDGSGRTFPLFQLITDSFFTECLRQAKLLIKKRY